MLESPGKVFSDARAVQISPDAIAISTGGASASAIGAVRTTVPHSLQMM
jgi:hypothetical protein